MRSHRPCTIAASLTDRATIAGASLIAPGVELLVELKPDSKIKFLLDNAPWPGIAFLVAGCIFGWLQYKMDARQEGFGMPSS
jgi:hypothetical protein